MTLSHPHNSFNTPQKMTDGSTALIWDRQQTPFGVTTAITGTATLNLRYPGQYADSASGLNYNYFRDYDSTLGRYIETDPIGLAGSSVASMNLYGYAEQNPLRYIDPKGEASIKGYLQCLFNEYFTDPTPEPKEPDPQENTDDNDCNKEWEDAIKICEELITKGATNTRGITGGYTSITDCARGLVSQRCGGNYVSQ